MCVENQRLSKRTILQFFSVQTKAATHIQHGYDLVWMRVPKPFVLITCYPHREIVCADRKNDSSNQNRDTWLVRLPTCKHSASRWKLQDWDRMSKLEKHYIWSLLQRVQISKGASKNYILRVSACRWLWQSQKKRLYITNASDDYYFWNASMKSRKHSWETCAIFLCEDVLNRTEKGF